MSGPYLTVFSTRNAVVAASFHLTRSAAQRKAEVATAYTNSGWSAEVYDLGELITIDRRRREVEIDQLERMMH
jgi:hypothetical protein